MELNNFFFVKNSDEGTMASDIDICLDKYKISGKGRAFFKEAALFYSKKKETISFYDDDDENPAAANVGLMRRILYFLKHREESLLEAVEKEPDLKNRYPLIFEYLLSDDDPEEFILSVMDFFQSEINELKSLEYTDIINSYPGKSAVRIIKAVRHLKELQGFRDVDAGVNYRIAEDGKMIIEDIDAEKKRKAMKIRPDEAFLKKWDVLRIYDYLDETIAGQEEAKALAAEILYEHVVRIVNPEAGIRKSNYLMYGPTGSGKTEIWRQLRIISPVPIFIMDSSEITMQGYKGNDKEDFFLAFNANSYGIDKGIIVLDEFDKLCQKRTNSEGENVGRVVQSELLKMIEGGDLVVDKKIFNTEAITFVCTGVFPDLFADTKKEDGAAEDEDGGTEKEDGGAKKDSSDTKKKDKENKGSIMQSLTEYGMLPELAGRISTVVALHELTLENYYDILCNSKENCLRNLRKKYRLAYNIELHITEDAMKAVAETARSAKLGVRAMQGILERTGGKYIMDILRNGESELTITRDMIEA